MRQWDWASRWAIVVLPPGQMPVRPDRAAAFRALADFDDRGSASARLRAWQAAERYWPDTALVHFGLGNARYALGERNAAASRFREALEIEPDYWPARLNLANVLMETGRPCDGLAVADRAMPAQHGLADARAGLIGRLREACDGAGGA
jgi:tetratricopeptide (TPR) repeat protein